MSRAFRALVLMMFVASCGSSNTTAPRNLDNACSIVSQHPDFLRAFKRAERDWGVPVPALMAMIYQESKFISNNRPPHKYTLGVIPVGRQSSAYGYSQALDGTWREYQQAEGGSRARRDNIFDAADFMGWYMSKSRDQLNLRMSDVYNQYLAYHEGRGGFKRGSYRSKSWLVRVAGEVAQRAVTYDVQLRSCGKI